jgi:hypothetical protein
MWATRKPAHDFFQFLKNLSAKFSEKNNGEAAPTASLDGG